MIATTTNSTTIYDIVSSDPFSIVASYLSPLDRFFLSQADHGVHNAFLVHLASASRSPAPANTLAQLLQTPLCYFKDVRSCFSAVISAGATQHNLVDFLEDHYGTGTEGLIQLLKGSKDKALTAEVSRIMVTYHETHVGDYVWVSRDYYEQFTRAHLSGEAPMFTALCECYTDDIVTFYSGLALAGMTGSATEPSYDAPRHIRGIYSKVNHLAMCTGVDVFGNLSEAHGRVVRFFPDIDVMEYPSIVSVVDEMLRELSAEVVCRAVICLLKYTDSGVGDVSELSEEIRGVVMSFIVRFAEVTPLCIPMEERYRFSLLVDVLKDYLGEEEEGEERMDEGEDEEEE